MSETIRGTVTRLFFQSPKFTAGCLLPVSDDVTRSREIRFAGKFYIRLGDLITLRGEWVRDPKYGHQLQVTEIVADTALDEKGLANWLAVHSAAVGIGPVKAEKIAQQLGVRFSEVLQDDPEQIAALAGVSLEVIENLAEAWFSFESFNILGTKLIPFGLTLHQIEVVYSRYGAKAVEILQEDPYRITDIEGVGFKTADEIASKFGIVASHPSRLRSALLHALKEHTRNGSTCLKWPQLVDAVNELLGTDFTEELDYHFQELLNFQKILKVQKDMITLPWLHRQEHRIAQFFLESNRPSGLGLAEINPLSCGFDLDESQQRAVSSALSHRCVLITGGAGVGKTYILRAIALLGRQAGLNVVLCAPTGKAARRIEEISNRQLHAMTIHRLLESKQRDGRWIFLRNQDNPLVADIVIVDEVSMVDVELANDFFSAIADHTSVVLIGDHHQLPPVGPGAILRDAINHELIPVNLLSTCHRQAGVLKRSCSAILEGRLEPTHKTAEQPGPWYVVDTLEDSSDVLRNVERLFTDVLPKWGFDPLRDVQFMTPIHRSDLGTRAINELLQRLWQRKLGREVEKVPDNHRLAFYEGDKVIQTKNNYDLGVMNGTLGVVFSEDPLVIDFEGKKHRIYGKLKQDVDLSYALTPHKFQGSEIPCAVVICHKKHSYMTHRNWIYTACTRARKTCIILGDSYGIKAAVERVKVNDRQTLLGILTREMATSLT